MGPITSQSQTALFFKTAAAHAHPPPCRWYLTQHAELVILSSPPPSPQIYERVRPAKHAPPTQAPQVNFLNVTQDWPRVCQRILKELYKDDRTMPFQCEAVAPLWPSLRPALWYTFCCNGLRE